MRATDVILKKRGLHASNNFSKNESTLSFDEIKFLIEGYVAGNIPDYQIASWLMAVFFRGMTFEETGFLTRSMLDSGDKINLHGKKNRGLIGPFVDKHSTGGVGDKISIPLAPIVASCGVQVPMMSGRALGHTGGTLDKLESIAGYKTNLTESQFEKIIAECGFAMTGQTKKIVPADRLLYALRDVTGTVESIPLITASILSKKVAEGSDALVFDVKCGSGAFMKNRRDAKLLATSLVKTSHALGKKATALITNMEHPLGNKIGNFLEIEESIECLQNRGPRDVMNETFALASEMLLLAKKAKTKNDALAKCKEAVSSGRALECFLKNVKAQGGNPNALMNEVGKRRGKFSRTFTAKKSGFVSLDALSLGVAGITLGVGRNKTTDDVSADAGFILHAKTGSTVKKGDVILEAFGKNAQSLKDASEKIENAISYTSEKPNSQKLIYEIIRD